MAPPPPRSSWTGVRKSGVWPKQSSKVEDVLHLPPLRSTPSKHIAQLAALLSSTNHSFDRSSLGSAIEGDGMGGVGGSSMGPHSAFPGSSCDSACQMQPPSPLSLHTGAKLHSKVSPLSPSKHSGVALMPTPTRTRALGGLISLPAGGLLGGLWSRLTKLGGKTHLALPPGARSISAYHTVEGSAAGGDDFEIVPPSAAVYNKKVKPIVRSLDLPAAPTLMRPAEAEAPRRSLALHARTAAAPPPPLNAAAQRMQQTHGSSVDAIKHTNAQALNSVVAQIKTAHRSTITDSACEDGSYGSETDDDSRRDSDYNDASYSGEADIRTVLVASPKAIPSTAPDGASAGAAAATTAATGRDMGGLCAAGFTEKQLQQLQEQMQADAERELAKVQDIAAAVAAAATAAATKRRAHAPALPAAAAATPSSLTADVSAGVQLPGAFLSSWLTHAPPKALPKGLLFQSAVMDPVMRRSMWSLEDYILVNVLHQNGATSVVQAMCTRSDQMVCLKMHDMTKILPELQPLVQREIALLAGLSHPNIVKLFAVFEEQDSLVMVMEWCSQGDLYDFARKKGGRLPECVVGEVVMPAVLSVLAYLHSQGILHRDIKPENILVCEDGRLALADFGVAIDLRRERAVTCTGTLDYMAPEVAARPLKSKPSDFKGDVSYSPAVDIYSLGVLVYELVVGFAPSVSYTTKPTVPGTGSLQDPICFPSSVSNAARQAIRSMLAQFAGNRPTAPQLLRHEWVCAC